MENQSENNAKKQTDRSLADAIGKKVLHKSIYLGGDLFDLSSDIMLYLPELKEHCPDVLGDSTEHLKSASKQLTSLLGWLDQVVDKS